MNNTNIHNFFYQKKQHGNLFIVLLPVSALPCTLVLLTVSVCLSRASMKGLKSERPYWSSSMSEVQALVPAGWVDSCPWATLLGQHRRAEWSWDLHFWFWFLQHHFYWLTHCPPLYLLGEALAEALLEARAQATITLSGIPLTRLQWWIFHGLLRPVPNHCCYLLMTKVSTGHSNHTVGYRGARGRESQPYLASPESTGRSKLQRTSQRHSTPILLWNVFFFFWLYKFEIITPFHISIFS